MHQQAMLRIVFFRTSLFGQEITQARNHQLSKPTIPKSFAKSST